jgi:hypothetical protein
MLAAFLITMSCGKPFVMADTKDSSKETAIADLDAAFTTRKAQVLSKFELEEKDLRSLETQLSGENRNMSTALEDAQAKGAELDAYLAALTAIDYLGSPAFINIFFPITVINLVLYLFFRESSFFRRHGKWIIVIGLLIIVLFLAAPLFAAEQEKAGDIAQNLDRVNSLLELKKSPLDEAIHILQNCSGLRKLGRTKVELPALEARASQLGLPRTVDLSAPLEIHYSLGVLYLEKGRTGEASEEFRSMIQPISDVPKLRYEQKETLENTLKYFVGLGKNYPLSEAKEFADAMVLFLGAHGRVDELIELARYLHDNKLTVSSREAINKAYEVTGRCSDLLKISTYYLPFNLTEARNALLASLDKAKTNEEILQAIQFSKENGAFQDEVIQKATEIMLRKSRNTQDLLNAADYLLRMQRTQEASLFISRSMEMSAGASQLLEIAHWSLEREIYQPARDAIYKLYKSEDWPSFFDRMDHPPYVPVISKDGKYEIVDERIRLVVFLGILDQALGNVDKARGLYEYAVNLELQEILESLGYSLSGNLNHFYYLKKSWERAGQEKNLLKLAPLYSYLQDEYLRQLADKKQAELAASRRRVDNLKQAKEQLIKQLGEVSGEIVRKRARFFLSVLRYVSFFGAVLLILYGCATRAWQYSKDISRHKTFAAFFKYIENIGWVQCFSVILFPIGIINVVVSQLMLILQMNQQGIERLSPASMSTVEASAQPGVDALSR